MGSRRAVRRDRALRLTVARFAATAAAALALAGCGEERAAQSPEEAPVGTSAGEPQRSYRDRLEPLAGSGVEGEALLSLLGSTLRVQLRATGLEPREEHVQHVHGLEPAGPSACPGRGADGDRDGALTLREAMPAYGAVGLRLEPFPRADRRGRVDFQGTFELPPEVGPLRDRVIVLYGADVNRVYDPTVPVACGRIR